MKKGRINLVTMGCSKNLVDSEVLLGWFERSGWEVFHDADGTGFDVVIVNTCGFIHDAKKESVDMILQYAGARKRGEIGQLFVMGCLSERYLKELKTEIPEVDRFYGKFELEKIATALKAIPDPARIVERKITTPSHYAYLKVSEGCNRTCGFCAIPAMTGRYTSRPIEELVSETRYLAGKGVKELLVIAQDLSYYGTDLAGKRMLSALTGEIARTEGIEWIRLHYFYPSGFPTEILPLMRENPKLCRYIDLPVQHISDQVLKRMKRRITGAETESLIKRIRREVPGVTLRTTLLVGYPGETEADFEELCRFVEETRFDRLGVFTYSHEEGTYAYQKLKDNIPARIKNERAARIMEIQKGISLELNEDKIGLKLTVLIDRKEGEFYIGRTRSDSPEVDGEVMVNSGRELTPGEFVRVLITDAEEYDLFGKVV